MVAMIVIPMGAMILLFLVYEVFLRRRRSWRTIIIIQILLGAVVGVAVKGGGAITVKTVLTLALLWVAAVLSVAWDGNMRTGNSKGTGWRRFRRRNIPKGSLHER